MFALFCPFFARLALPCSAFAFTFTLSFSFLSLSGRLLVGIPSIRSVVVTAILLLRINRWVNLLCSAIVIGASTSQIVFRSGERLPGLKSQVQSHRPGSCRRSGRRVECALRMIKSSVDIHDHQSPYISHVSSDAFSAPLSS